MASGIFLLHALVLLLLFQCAALKPDERRRVSYLNVHIEQTSNHLALEFQDPPERMFYQYAAMPLEKREDLPQPLAYPRWEGWQTLVALRTEESTPMEYYRLTLESRRQEEDERFIHYRPVFRTVVVRGRVLQPVVRVPEPSSAFLASFGLLALLAHRSRKWS